MTSNLGNQLAEKYRLGFNDGRSSQEIDQKNRLFEALKNHFKPEFLNRIDEVIVFNRLQKTDLAKIAGLEFEALAQRLQTKNIKLKVKPEVKKIIAQKCYLTQYGARPLKRYIQKHILSRLSKQVIGRKIKPGSEVIIDKSWLDK